MKPATSTLPISLCESAKTILAVPPRIGLGERSAMKSSRSWSISSPTPTGPGATTWIILPMEGIPLPFRMKSR